MDSILTSIKKLLGIQEDYTHFDTDIIIHINSALMILNQLGVGKENFFITSDDETWDDFLDDNKSLEAIKTIVYLRVRLTFDPPSNAFVVDSIERMIKELEWRVNVNAEANK